MPRLSPINGVEVGGITSMPAKARAKEMARLISVGESTLWAMAARGVIPAPVRVSGRVTLFDVRATLEAIDSLPRAQ